MTRQHPMNIPACAKRRPLFLRRRLMCRRRKNRRLSADRSVLGWVLNQRAWTSNLRLVPDWERRPCPRRLVLHCHAHPAQADSIPLP